MMCAPFTGSMISLAPLPSGRLPGWEDVGDFWNDPRRWDDIKDPQKEMFWTIERPKLPAGQRLILSRVAGRAARQYALDSTPA